MKRMISELLTQYENRTLSRRALISTLTMVIDPSNDISVIFHCRQNPGTRSSETVRWGLPQVSLLRILA